MFSYLGSKRKLSSVTKLHQALDEKVLKTVNLVFKVTFKDNTSEHVCICIIVYVGVCIQ